MSDTRSFASNVVFYVKNKFSVNFCQLFGSSHRSYSDDIWICKYNIVHNTTLVNFFATRENLDQVYLHNLRFGRKIWNIYTSRMSLGKICANGVVCAVVDF